MRAIAILAFILLVLSSTNAWSYRVSCTDRPILSVLPTAGTVGNQYSSFRGISLASKSGDVASNSLKLGFLIYLTTFLGLPNAVSSIDICQGDINFPVGHVDFDESGQPIRLWLTARYFYERPITEREFAEAVFKHYSVHPVETADDSCVQGMICFRGRTDAGEHFLIFKVGDEITLHVRRLRANE